MSCHLSTLETMTTFQLIPPMDEAQQIAAQLAHAAARQPNLPLIRAAVAARHPHLSDAEQDELAQRVAAEMPRAMISVGFPEQTVLTTDHAAAVATVHLTKAVA